MKFLVFEQHFPHQCRATDLMGGYKGRFRFRCRVCGGKVSVSSSDPLGSVLLHMERFEEGSISKDRLLVVLSRYELLIRNLHEQVEACQAESELLHQGTLTLRDAVFRLRLDLENGTPGNLNEVRERLLRGTDLLFEFRETAEFEGDEEGESGES